MCVLQSTAEQQQAELERQLQAKQLEAQLLQQRLETERLKLKIRQLSDSNKSAAASGVTSPAANGSADGGVKALAKNFKSQAAAGASSSSSAPAKRQSAVKFSEEVCST